MSRNQTNTIEAIENDFWDNSEYPTTLVRRCHELMKKNLDLFEIEDYRILIGQNIALEILMPHALKILKENFFAEGDCYEGDLLNAVLKSDKNYWNEHVELKNEMIKLMEKNIEDLQNLDSLLQIDKHILEILELFKA